MSTSLSQVIEKSQLSPAGGTNNEVGEPTLNIGSRDMTGDVKEKEFNSVEPNNWEPNDAESKCVESKRVESNCVEPNRVELNCEKSNWVEPNRVEPNSLEPNPAASTDEYPERSEDEGEQPPVLVPLRNPPVKLQISGRPMFNAPQICTQD